MPKYQMLIIKDDSEKKYLQNKAWFLNFESRELYFMIPFFIVQEDSCTGGYTQLYVRELQMLLKI